MHLSDVARRRQAPAGLVLAALASTLVTSCAVAPRGGGTAEPLARDAAAPFAPKTLRLGKSTLPASANAKLVEGRGSNTYRWIFDSYLTGIDARSAPVPMLAADVPSLEQRTWTVNPDGSMETVWRLRPSARWHDGRPITSYDFVFTWQVYLDPDFPIRSRVVERLISEIETPDDRTLIMKWAQPYIDANLLHADTLAPLPAHVLEQLYRADKQAFVDSRFWTSEYVGSGPFKVEQWDPANGVIVGLAHDGFALGRPPIDRLRIELLPSEQAVLTSLLAGALDVTVTPHIDLPEIAVLKERWEPQGHGRVGLTPGGLDYLQFQLRDVPGASSAIQTREVREALAYAIDRRAMADTLPVGMLVAADYPMASNDPFLPMVERVARKLPFDSARAGSLLDAAGWGRGADAVRRNGAGARLAVAVQGDDVSKLAVIADNWQRVGVEAAVSEVPAARLGDREFRANFTGANYNRWTPRWTGVPWTTDRIPTVANRWVGDNAGGYSNPVADALVRRIETSVDQRERGRHAAELMRVWMEDVAVVPIMYVSRGIAAASGVGGYDVDLPAVQPSHTWSIYRWTKD